MKAAGEHVFREEQRLRQWWVRAIVLVVAAIGWWAFIAQIILGNPWGSRPAPDWAIWLVFALVGLGLPVLVLIARLIVTVDATHLRIRWSPIVGRTIPIGDIESAEVRTYRPVAEFGGWGIRWMPGRGTAWNAGGNRGVQLVLKGGKRVLVGSQRPEDLAAALRPAVPRSLFSS